MGSPRSGGQSFQLSLLDGNMYLARIIEVSTSLIYYLNDQNMTFLSWPERLSQYEPIRNIYLAILRLASRLPTQSFASKENLKIASRAVLLIRRKIKDSGHQF